MKTSIIAILLVALLGIAAAEDTLSKVSIEPLSNPTL